MGKNKWIDLSNLPKWYNNQISWKKSIGYIVKFRYKDIINEIKIKDYDGKLLTLEYKDITDFKIATGSFINCSLGKLLNKYLINFKLEIGDIIKDEKRNLIIKDRKKDKNNKKKYLYHCNKCRYEKWIDESALTNIKQGCASCCGNDINVGYNDIPTTAPWMIDYFPGGIEQAKQYTKCSDKKIIPICPYCGRSKNKEMSIFVIYQNHSIGCPCQDGIKYPEKFMFNFLEQILNNNFEYQYISEWIKPKKYDFYFKLNDKQYIIETDGEWHKKDNNLSGQTKEESKAIDNYKDKLAEQHNIKVIRINCEKSTLEHIKEEILKSELKNLFDLFKIDWGKCHEFAISNRVKEACELKKNNSELTTKEITEKTELCRTTIIKYLKQGNILGWCEYNSQKELKIIQQKRNKSIEIFKNGESLGVFKNIIKLKNQILNELEIKLHNKYIVEVCNGKRKNYKGFTFKFVEK